MPKRPLYPVSAPRRDGENCANPPAPAPVCRLRRAPSATPPAAERIKRGRGSQPVAAGGEGIAGLWLQRVAAALTVALAAGLTAWGAIDLVHMLAAIDAHGWLVLGYSLFLTFLRTAAALVLGALWAVPIGVWIGLSPRRTRRRQPIIQVAASFPAPMIFPVVTLAILALHVPFAWGCVALMLLGSQWYILFNVLSGATAMPHDLREAADVYGVGGLARWRTLYLPAVFPSLVTGLITAAGGAWNASIVAEVVRTRGETLVAPGLGSLITNASESGNFPLLAAGVLTMALALVALNRTVWRRLYHLADQRYGLNR